MGRSTNLSARIALLALVAGASSLGCSGQTLDLGYDDTHLTAAGSNDPVDFAAARARCDAPDTADELAADNLQMHALLFGRWIACDDRADEEGLPVPALSLAENVYVPLKIVEGRLVADDTRRGVLMLAKDLSCCHPPTWVMTVRDQLEVMFVLSRGPLRMRMLEPGKASAPRPVIRRYVRV